MSWVHTDRHVWGVQAALPGVALALQTTPGIGLQRTSLRLAATLAFLTATAVQAGCDAESELPPDRVAPAAAAAPDPDPDSSTTDPRLNECELLGADQSCGPTGAHIQFCAWLYNEDTREVSTYWGACVPEPECSLWACREGDGALCDLVEGQPRWVADACDW